VKRLSIRILVALVVCIAVAVSASVPTPVDADDHQALPAVALEQVAIYRLEVVLMVFYGGLLLITPTFFGLVGGRLPIEISARGARFAEEADQSSKTTEAAIRNLEVTAEGLSEDLAAALFNIEKLERLARDNKLLKVDSKP
jgi:hypothetical protein